VTGSTTSGKKWSSQMCSPSFVSTHSWATPGPITSDSPYMSTASIANRSSISRRISSLHGSAPKIPTRSDVPRGSTPWRSNSSRIVSMYEGVTMMITGFRSWMSWT
jgi:hypothetical protein